MSNLVGNPEDQISGLTPQYKLTVVSLLCLKHCNDYRAVIRLLQLSHIMRKQIVSTR